MGRLAGSRPRPGKARGARPLRRRQPVLSSFAPATPGAPGWQAWFDGSALPNPGKMGLGVVLLAPDGTRTELSMIAAGSGCNNEAELHALRAALEMAADAGARRLLLRGDSDVALRYVRGPDATRIGRLCLLVARARESLRRFEAVQLVWVPRHRNIEADGLSRRALGLAAGTAPVAGRGRRRR